jgi:hypothetical protein
MNILSRRLSYVLLAAIVAMTSMLGYAGDADDKIVVREWGKYMEMTERKLKEKEQAAERIKRLANPDVFVKDTTTSAMKIAKEGAKGIRSVFARNLFQAASKAQNQLAEFAKIGKRETDFLEYLDGKRLAELEREISGLRNDLTLSKNYLDRIGLSTRLYEADKMTLRTGFGLLLNQLGRTVREAEDRQLQVQIERGRRLLEQTGSQQAPGSSQPGAGLPRQP